jgi:2-oxo-3-hexenedioate decarboxylase
MKLDQATIAQLAEHLENAELQAHDVVKITDAHPEMDWDDAYAIQAEILRRKLARGNKGGRPEVRPDLARQDEADGRRDAVLRLPGRLFHGRRRRHGQNGELIHPKVEPEIAFVLKTPLKGPGCHVGAVLAATDFVMAGIEVIDSRYRDFKFDLKSVIADNCSSARYVLGGVAAPVAGLDLRTLGVVMEKNGQPVAIGAGAAVLGHPAAAIAMLANHLGARGEEIPAGTMILSGGVTEAVAVNAGDHVNLRVQSLGSVSDHFA